MNPAVSHLPRELSQDRARRRLAPALLATLVAWACTPEVRAQATESRPPKADTRWFTASLGAVLLVDYSGFRQDANSLSQVGRQPPHGPPGPPRRLRQGPRFR